MQKTLLHLTIGIVFIVPSILTAQTARYQVVPNHTADTSIPPTVTIIPDAQLQSQCGVSCSHTAYRLVHQLNCGATVAIEDVLSHKPTCKMIPRVSTGGAVMLEWDTTNASTVFIDSGVGHVSVAHGARIVTPRRDMTYSMTVVSEGGLVGVCSSIINVSNAKAQQNELLVIGSEQEALQTQLQDGIYTYNEDAINHNATMESLEVVGESNSREIAHTATMSANGPFVRATSFFSSGIFLIFSLLMVLVGALWLIIRHGVR